MIAYLLRTLIGRVFGHEMACPCCASESVRQAIAETPIDLG